MKNKKLNGLAYVLVGSLFIGGLTVSAVNNEKTNITKDDAKEIALTDVNVENSKDVKVEFDKEDQQYEIEFKDGNKEVEVEVDLKGNVVEKDVEKVKEQPKQVVKAEATFITKDEAKAIAFKNANVKESEVTRLKVKLDKEDKEYEVEFYVGTTEYDYEINAVTGKIIKVEKDIEKVKEQSNKTVITKDKALKIALEKANVKVNEVRDLEVELDDGKYEICFEVKNVEYEVKVSLTGKILKFEKENDD